MRPSRCVLLAGCALGSTLARSLDYAVGPFDKNDAGGDVAGGSGNPAPPDAGNDGPDGRSTPPPSCASPKTCNGTTDCCASNLVSGGTFNRDNNATFPAKVSDFRLDVFEITVGRFRAFVEAGTLPQAL